MDYAAASYLSVAEMESIIRAKFFKKRGKLPNNFKKTLPGDLPSSALEIFRSDYFLDFMTEDDVKEEKQVESKMISNIKKFILTMGKGFCFIGNQYRIDAAGKDNFIDLLFFNRILKCLVVIELKKNEFKPEHAGKLNFHLNMIDDKLKLPHENPTIGIILCKAKSDLMVEYSIRDINKAMGVATYKVSKKRPGALSKVLPSEDKLIRFLEEE
jgi:predicted nuclease of restriction endonuclease-like (RecB) superfamily